MGIPLNIDWQQILLHLLNFAILATGLSFLLFEPVRRFMEKRQAYFADLERENKEKTAQAIEKEKKYTELIEQAEEEIRHKSLEAEDQLKREAEEIRIMNQRAAEEMIIEANKTIKAEEEKSVKELKGEVASLAVSIASGILEREITAEDDAKIIDECLNEWSKNRD